MAHETRHSTCITGDLVASSWDPGANEFKSKGRGTRTGYAPLLVNTPITRRHRRVKVNVPSRPSGPVSTLPCTLSHSVSLLARLHLCLAHQATLPRISPRAKRVTTWSFSPSLSHRHCHAHIACRLPRSAQRNSCNRLSGPSLSQPVYLSVPHSLPPQSQHVDGSLHCSTAIAPNRTAIEKNKVGLQRVVHRLASPPRHPALAPDRHLPFLGASPKSQTRSSSASSFTLSPANSSWTTLRRPPSPRA